MSYFLFGLARTRRAAGNRHLIPRTIVQTIVSIPLSPSRNLVRSPAPATSSGSNRLHPRSRDPPIANHRAGLTLMKAAVSISMGHLSLFFFPTSCSSAVLAFRNSPCFIPREQRQRSLTLSLSISM